MSRGKLAGKVAFITGVARGQGRSHAIRLAEEGADIIGVDIARQIDSVAYPMAGVDDLAQTAKDVEELDRRILTFQADVRDFTSLEAAVDAGVAEFGRLDIVLANAGIAPHAPHERDAIRAFEDVIAVNLEGVRHTVHAAVRHLIDQGGGGSIVITGSAEGLTGRGGDGSGGMDGYVAAKAGVVGLMRSYANWLAPHRIRVNSVHPTAVDTPMATSQTMQDFLAVNPGAADAMSNLLPVEMIEARDVSNAIAWLVSEEARYVTGVALPIDAGFTIR